jgi:hypothetical protein
MLALPLAATGATPTTGYPALPADLWSVLVNRSSGPKIAFGLADLRQHGLNSVILDGSGLSVAAKRAVRRSAARLRLIMIELVQSPLQCPAIRRRGDLCAIQARALAQTATAGTVGSDVVVVRVHSPRSVLRVPSNVSGRVIAILPLASRSLQSRTWGEAISVAKRDSHLDLGVAPTTQAGQQGVRAYLRLLGSFRNADLYVAKGGSEVSRCSFSAPCGSLNRAYSLAKAGQVVEVGGGDYGDQVIDLDPSKVNAPADVLFHPARGAVVIMNRLMMFGSHAVFSGERQPDGSSNWIVRHISSDSTEGPTTSGFVTFENMDARSFFIGSNHDITIRSTNIGPSRICSSGPFAALYTNRIGGGAHDPGQVPSNILLDGLVVHDQNSDDIHGCHTGGLQFVSGDHVVIRNSIFYKDAVYDISIGSSSGIDNPENVTIENNWFGAPVYAVPEDSINNGEGELQFSGRGGEWVNWLIRFNSFHNGPSLNIGDPTPHVNTRVIGNIGGGPPCPQPGVTYSYNVWVGGTCGPTDRSVRKLPYRNVTIGHEDFHLTGGVARDLVRGKGPDYAVSRDIDNEHRPRGRARDAGADER